MLLYSTPIGCEIASDKELTTWNEGRVPRRQHDNGHRLRRQCNRHKTNGSQTAAKYWSPTLRAARQPESSRKPDSSPEVRFAPKPPQGDAIVARQPSSVTNTRQDSLHLSINETLARRCHSQHTLKNRRTRMAVPPRHALLASSQITKKQQRR